jgi:hypothetical protein
MLARISWVDHSSLGASCAPRANVAAQGVDLFAGASRGEQGRPADLSGTWLRALLAREARPLKAPRRATRLSGTTAATAAHAGQQRRLRPGSLIAPLHNAVMHLFTAWCGFVGAWVLVTGPVYQGAVELDEVEVDRKAIRSQADTTADSERISPWWWLVPPVAYVKTTRNQNAWRHQVMASLTPQQRVQFLTYSNKATGWFLVAADAALSASSKRPNSLKLSTGPAWPRSRWRRRRPRLPWHTRCAACT